MERFDSIELLHPKTREAFRLLNEYLVSSYELGETRTSFQVFETFRSPDRQERLRKLGRSKARGWQSAHQYGCAVDFVPVLENEATARTGYHWSWDLSHDWKFLADAAVKFGLRRPIKWDLAHIEHPLFVKFRQI